MLEFSAIQILREFNFRDFRSAEPAILAVLKALNLDLGKFQLWKIAKIHQIQSIINGSFYTSEVYKIDFT